VCSKDRSNYIYKQTGKPLKFKQHLRSVLNHALLSIIIDRVDKLFFVIVSRLLFVIETVVYHQKTARPGINDLKVKFSVQLIQLFNLMRLFPVQK